METGFIPDYGFMNEIAQSQWIEGEPEKSWLGVKQKGKKFQSLIRFAVCRVDSQNFMLQEKRVKPANLIIDDILPLNNNTISYLI